MTGITPLFKKLNFKNQASILVLNAPKSMNAELDAMVGFSRIIKDLDQLEEIELVMAFVTRQAEIDSTIEELAPKLKGDAVLWFCFPKGTSKKYTCDFNRDTGWSKVGAYNFESVRMVAIDEDWSALRFRKIEYVKTMTRKESHAISGEGKRRVKK